MAKITFCDRCAIEIRRVNKDGANDEFNDEDFNGIFENLDGMLDNLMRVQKFHLCDKCLKGYNKIINNANKEISNFMKSANKDEGKSKDKKFSFFKKFTLGD